MNLNATEASIAQEVTGIARTPTNVGRCLKATASEGFVFVPEDYVIRFGRAQVNLDPINNISASEMAIIDLKTRQQVITTCGKFWLPARNELRPQRGCSVHARGWYEL